MNSKSVAFKLKVFTLVIIISSGFTSIYSYNLLYSENTFYPKVNKGRLLTSSAKTNIEEALVNNDFSASLESQYPFAAIDLHGKVLLSTISKYKKGMTVNINNFIEYDNKASLEEPGLIKYSTPLIVNEIQAGTAIFFIPPESMV